MRDRMIKIIDELGLSIPDFAESLDVSKELIYMIQSGGRNISKVLANKIQDIYGVPAEYSKDGIGEFRVEKTLIRLAPFNQTNEVKIDKPILADKGVPYYDVDFIGGFDVLINDQTVNPLYYIDFVPYNDADCWLNVTGKSMGPLIAHGDIVALKEVNDWQDFLLENEIYAIVTKNGFRTIKILGPGPDEDHYMLEPYNKSYKPQLIPKKIITRIYRVKGALKKFF